MLYTHLRLVLAHIIDKVLGIRFWTLLILDIFYQGRTLQKKTPGWMFVNKNFFYYNKMDIVYLNTFMIAILIAVTFANMIIMFVTRQEVDKQKTKAFETHQYIQDVNDNLEAIMIKIREGIHYKIDSSIVSIMDLAEFKDLDPSIKNAYKKYMLNEIIPAIAAAIKKEVQDNDIDGWIARNDTKIQEVIQQVANRIRYNGIGTIPGMVSVLENSKNPR